MSEGRLLKIKKNLENTQCSTFTMKRVMKCDLAGTMCNYLVPLQPFFNLLIKISITK